MKNRRPAPPAAAASAQNFFWPVAGLVLLTLLAYLPSFTHGFIWDDDHYVTRNGTLRDLAGLGRIWFQVGATPQYYPLVHSTFWLEFHLWGLNATGYHVVNTLLHALAAVLFWRVLVRLQLPGAWFAAALFALHPVQVESVAWITERKNVLSAVFYFAAALAYLRWEEKVESRKLKAEIQSQRARPASFQLWVFALALFLCALWSKTVTCSLPAALLLVRWWKTGRVCRADILPLLPFFALGAGMGLLTAWIEQHGVGASGAPWTFSFADRVLIAGRAVWFYAAKLAWPEPLMFFYPRWQISSGVWWQWLFPLGALALVAALWIFRARLGRGPLTSVLLFGGTLFPALGFFNVYPMRYSFVADHFQYLASASLLALMATGISRWSSGFVAFRVQVTRGIQLALLLTLAALTWRQTADYRDEETLWRATLKKNPACAIAHNNLGALLAARGETAAAEAEYRAALASDADDEETMSNLGVALAEQGRTDEALELLQRALRRAPADAEVHANHGQVLARAGRPAEALAAFREAVRLQPQRAEFHYNLATQLAQSSQTAAAIVEFRETLRLRPGHADAHNNLALALAARGEPAAALAEYTAALQADPSHAMAHNNLGALLLRDGQLAAAVTHFAAALRAQPDYATAHFNLGNARALQKDFAAAALEFAAAVRFAPANADFRKNLGLALVRLGRVDDARAEFREAVRLQPENAEAARQLQRLEAAPAH